MPTINVHADLKGQPLSKFVRAEIADVGCVLLPRFIRRAIVRRSLARYPAYVRETAAARIELDRFLAK